ncbi:hypothetical protein Taro_050473, partial [Colocasia esculenta]|nr:hypothetical protein [Colocasia esculenta]
LTALVTSEGEPRPRTGHRPLHRRHHRRAASFLSFRAATVRPSPCEREVDGRRLRDPPLRSPSFPLSSSSSNRLSHSPEGSAPPPNCRRFTSTATTLHRRRLGPLPRPPGGCAGIPPASSWVTAQLCTGWDVRVHPAGGRQRYQLVSILFPMGLLSIIRKIKKKEKEMRILMVGLDNSGKTTIVLKINGEDTSIISPTLGFNIKTIKYEKYSLNIWDVGGQKTIRSYWRNYFEKTDGLVWVVDSSDIRRLDDCKMELCNLLKEERLSGASLLIFANKQDIQGALSPAEIAKVLNLDAMEKTRHWRIVGCSAYTGEGLLGGFDWLVQDIASRIYVLD